MRLRRRTKDRKKGCAYDPGVLNKQGALKKTDFTVCLGSCFFPGIVMHTAPVATVFGEAARSGLVSGSVHTRSVAKALGSGTGIRSSMLALTPQSLLLQQSR